MRPGSETARLPASAHGVWTVMREALLVALVGACVGLLANRVSPRGLSLTRNYFPEIATPVVPSAIASSTNSNSAKPNEDPVEARLRARGLTAVRMDEVASLHADARYAAGLILFIDAREDRVYEAGHIPGALPFDHYHPELRLAEAITAAQTAEIVVIYCNGGECEDSEFAALMLKDAGIPLERLRIYTGGISEWNRARRSVETGARFSGVVREGAP